MGYQKERKIPLSQLNIGHGTQMRVEINQETVMHYLEVIDDLPPIEAVETMDGELIVWDGFHRIEAWRTFANLNKKGKDIKVPVNCQPGDAEDAIWLACGANARHGLPMSTADKQRAVKTALEMFPNKSQAEIAKHCGVSNGMVFMWRKRLRGDSPQAATDTSLLPESNDLDPQKSSQVGCSEVESNSSFVDVADQDEDAGSHLGGINSDALERDFDDDSPGFPDDIEDQSGDSKSEMPEETPKRPLGGVQSGPATIHMPSPYTPDWNQLQASIGAIARWIDSFGAAHKMKESNPARALRGDVEELLQNIVGWCHSVNGCLPPWPEARKWAERWIA